MQNEGETFFSLQKYKKRHFHFEYFASLKKSQFFRINF
jgi:hypothetical protein